MQSFSTLKDLYEDGSMRIYAAQFAAVALSEKYNLPLYCKLPLLTASALLTMIVDEIYKSYKKQKNKSESEFKFKFKFNFTCDLIRNSITTTVSGAAILGAFGLADHFGINSNFLLKAGVAALSTHIGFYLLEPAYEKFVGCTLQTHVEKLLKCVYEPSTQPTI